MKKIVIELMVGVLFFIASLLINPKGTEEVHAQARPEYMQDIMLDKMHFPDEHIRNQLARTVDQNKDGILSRIEREKIYYLTISNIDLGLNKYWYPDMNDLSEENKVYNKTKYSLWLGYSWTEGRYSKEKILDLTGIEYFFNLREVRVDGYEMITGSFRNNTNLRKIWVGCSEKKEAKSFDTIREDFPVSQLTYIHLKNIISDTIKLEDVPNLSVLRVIQPDGSNKRFTSLNLSNNKKLKELELGNIVPARLDLRKHQKLTSVKVYCGTYKYGQQCGGNLDEDANSYYRYYLPEKNQKCKILFARKNKIRTLHYFTGNKTIDITRLSKLEDFETLKSVKVKVKSSWIRKTFTKKKWGCAIIKSGKFLQKIKAAKKKKYTVI